MIYYERLYLLRFWYRHWQQIICALFETHTWKFYCFRYVFLWSKSPLMSLVTMCYLFLYFNTRIPCIDAKSKFEGQDHMMQGRWLMVTGAQQKTLLINNMTKAQTSLTDTGAEEESARHQVALVQNLLMFTL